MDPSDFVKKFVSYNKYLFVNMHKGILFAILMVTLFIVYAFRKMIQVEELLFCLFVVCLILFMTNVIRTPKLYSLWHIKPPKQRVNLGKSGY